MSRQTRIRVTGPLVGSAIALATARHRTASELLRDQKYHAGAESSPTAEWALRRGIAPDALGPLDPPSMLVVDPPDHTRYRRLVSKVFTPHTVAAAEPEIERIAKGLLDAFPETGVVDLVAAYAKRLPVAVIAHLMGIPEHMLDQFLRWSDSAAPALDLGVTYREYTDADAALRQTNRWLRAHFRREHLAFSRGPHHCLGSGLAGSRARSACARCSNGFPGWPCTASRCAAPAPCCAAMPACRPSPPAGIADRLAPRACRSALSARPPAPARTASNRGQVLLAHPDVADRVVVGATDETWGEQVAAVVAARRHGAQGQTTPLSRSAGGGNRHVAQARCDKQTRGRCARPPSGEVGCPWRIGRIVAAALAILHHEHHRTT